VIRTTAVFEHDETRLARIAPRFSGWAGRLKINFTGQPVAKGEPLLSVYSPDLLSAESEYLLALRRFRQVGGTGTTVESEPAERLVESARRKLRLWQIDEEEIRELERRGEPSEEICLRSPISGHVVGKNVVEGKSFMAGETLYEIADLSHLWLRASVSENDLSLVRIGQRARIILPCLENAVYFSMVTFLYPHIDPQTRRAEIRLEVDNPNHDLRPDMWANVELDASIGSRLALPASAVIDTGLRYVAFVKKDDQRLEPREIKVGIKTDDYYEVLQGADAGESVVTRALFLVDSESQLKSVVAGMTTPGSEPQ
jgi:Cu(I)/Ag(I) efflux system membrane fusion protein